MKTKMIVLILFLLIFASGACGCDFSGKSVNQSKAPESTESNSDTQQPPIKQCLSDEDHDYVAVSRTDALALKDGEITYQCQHCKREYSEKLPATNSLKVLALGNSFTDDGMMYLPEVLEAAGIENVVLEIGRASCRERVSLCV